MLKEISANWLLSRSQHFRTGAAQHIGAPVGRAEGLSRVAYPGSPRRGLSGPTKGRVAAAFFFCSPRVDRGAYICIAECQSPCAARPPPVSNGPEQCCLRPGSRPGGIGPENHSYRGRSEPQTCGLSDLTGRCFDPAPRLRWMCKTSILAAPREAQLR